jgi:sec-independent protein translocase protein TatA
MGEIGFEKILLILLIVLLLFGARRIPELAGSMGKGIREFKKNLSDPDRAARDSGALHNDSPADRVSGAPQSPPSGARPDAEPEPKRLMR